MYKKSFDKVNKLFYEPRISWLKCLYNDDEKRVIKKPDELENEMVYPPSETLDQNILNKVLGSMMGLAVGDALGAHVEFRPHDYLRAKPVQDLQGGGTWGLSKGQFTDDTSMALCLAASLIERGGFVPYDQLVRYKWWYKEGYMSSTGHCFDIGSATKQALIEFEKRQKGFAAKKNITMARIDFLSDKDHLMQFKIDCGDPKSAGNGALMRLAPVPLFFYRDPKKAVAYAGISSRTTHGDVKACDACRFYAALIVGALEGRSKEDLLSNAFYEENASWFGDPTLHPDIKKIAEGSYKKPGDHKGYEAGIRGKGYIVPALEAALWAFWNDGNSFEKGVLMAVNLGDDTDTTAAIYGQLAGAYYGFKALPERWVNQIYAKRFIECLSKWIVYEGGVWLNNEPTRRNSAHAISIDDLPPRRVRGETVSTDNPTLYFIANAKVRHHDDKSLKKSTEPKHSPRSPIDTNESPIKSALSLLAPPPPLEPYPYSTETRRHSHHRYSNESSNPQQNM